MIWLKVAACILLSVLLYGPEASGGQAEGRNSSYESDYEHPGDMEPALPYTSSGKSRRMPARDNLNVDPDADEDLYDGMDDDGSFPLLPEDGRSKTMAVSDNGGGVI